MNKPKKATKSTYFGRSSTKSGRSPLADPKFTAHRFKMYCKAFGFLLRKMRKSRGLRQSDLGAPTQIRRLEQGRVAQVSRMEVLAKLVPCPREALKFLRAMIENLPIACLGCRKECGYKDCTSKHIIERHFDDLTVEYPPDFEFEPSK